MANRITIRPTTADDWPALRALYPAAFPDEDLLPLVADLLAADPPVLSLAAEMSGDLAGHVVMTRCQVGEASVALLGPLAVAPEVQRRGIGSALVRAAFERSASGGLATCLVLGDPAYYGRFGFRSEPRVTPPYPLPDGWAPAWQSLALDPDVPAPRGALIVPGPWRVPHYWTA